MRFFGTVALLLGYTLVYAAVANHGAFATNPWAALVADAYTGKHPKVAEGSGAQPSSPGVGPGGQGFPGGQGELPGLRRIRGGQGGHPGR